MKGKISDFLKHHYRHFNAAALIDAAEGYKQHLDGGGKMMITLAGAMSTAELGLSLAELYEASRACAHITIPDPAPDYLKRFITTRLAGRRPGRILAAGRGLRPAYRPRGARRG